MQWWSLLSFKRWQEKLQSPSFYPIVYLMVSAKVVGDSDSILYFPWGDSCTFLNSILEIRNSRLQTPDYRLLQGVVGDTLHFPWWSCFSVHKRIQDLLAVEKEQEIADCVAYYLGHPVERSVSYKYIKSSFAAALELGTRPPWGVPWSIGFRKT